MHSKIKLLISILFVTFSVTLFGQRKNININLKDFKTGDIPLSSIYFGEMGVANSMNNNDSISFYVDHLPTLIQIGVLDQHKFHLQKLIWINQQQIKISGSLNNLDILPINDQQEYADKIFPYVLKNKIIKNNLAYSKPYLVHLVDKIQFIKTNHIKDVLNRTPEGIKDFWAFKYLKQYLEDLDNVGFDPKSKTLSYVIAINKLKQNVKYEVTGEKYTLLDFSGSGCLPCITSIDKLVPIYSALKNNLEIVMLWNDRNYDMWINRAKKQKDKISWISLQDGNGAIFEAFNIKAYPTYILFDKHGQILKKWTNAFPKLKELKKLMK